MPKVGELLRIGIDSLKVEGRNKSLYYVSIVTRAYRMAIDDWYKDPDNWTPNKYLEELHTIPNRGYTLAFFDGRLTNHAHSYDYDNSLSSYEFAGIITEADETGITIDVRNKLNSGDVLEFVPPKSRRTILLRVYEFHNPYTGEIRESVNGGCDHFFKVPFTAFDREDQATIKMSLVPLTVLRKDKNLIPEHRHQLSLNILSQEYELEKCSPNRYETTREELKELQSNSPRQAKIKTPRLGKEGCCAKGCNGCLIFTHDPEFARARELFKKKKIGEKLDTSSCNIQI